MMRRAAFAATAALALLGAPAIAATGGPGSAPEPDGLHMGVMQGYTPASLKGAKVVETPEVVALAEKGGAAFFDVGPEDRKPETLPASAVWRPQHRTIPDAVWFPGGGPGDLPARVEDALKARIETLTGGDRAKPIVTFCKPDCWGSWNLGKRLVTWGYTNVHWFPQGVNGWMEADKPTAIVKADPEWLEKSKPEAER